MLGKWAGFTRAVRSAETAGVAIHTVRYENMLTDGVGSLRGCVDYLLPQNSISDTQLQTAVDANSFQTLSGGREPGNIDGSSNLRRGQSGSWRDELNPGLAETFNPEDRELLESLGYAS